MHIIMLVILSGENINDGVLLTSDDSHCMSTSGLFPSENSATTAAWPTSHITHRELESTEARWRE